MFLEELNEPFRENWSKFVTAGYLVFWKQFPAAGYVDTSKILLKRCRFSFFSEQDKRSTVKKPTRLKSLRANQCSAESFFSSFSTKRKLMDDSFELSGSHLCLKTVHSALHWEATQQNSPLLFLANKNYHMKLYDKSEKLTIFTISRKKHLQQLVLVFQKL